MRWLKIKKVLSPLYNLLVIGLFATGCASTADLLVSHTLPYATQMSTCEPGESHVSPIVGGETVTRDDPDARLVVEIRIRRGMKDSVCTGSLINDWLVLTAAHCVMGTSPDVYTQFVTKDGCPFRHYRRHRIAVDEFILHPEFDGDPRAFKDLAILKLKNKAPEDQRRLALNSETSSNRSKDILLLGFGVTGEDKTDSMILRRVRKSQDEVVFKDGILLVDQKARSSGFCRGDSGAPLITFVDEAPQIIGVNSANVGSTAGKRDECHTLSVAMDVRTFGPWIQETMDELTPRPSIFSW